MTLTIGDVHPFHLILISLGLGLLIGLQRQWAGALLGGIRTFSLLSLFGTLCGFLAEQYGAWPVAMGFISVCVLILVGHIGSSEKSHEKKLGITTESSMLLTYGIGILVFFKPIWIAVVITGLVAVILQAKVELHRVASRFEANEIKAIMQFVLISLVIFPIVPNAYIDPYQVINPHNIWLMVILIVAISLCGYVTYKFFGERAGILLGGILGGIISSTATTAAYSKRSKNTSSPSDQNALVIAIAWTVLYIRVFLEVIVASPKFREAWAPIGIMFFVSSISSLWLWRRGKGQRSEMPQQKNPTELTSAVTFSVLYAIILFTVVVSKQYLDVRWLTAIAIPAGVAEIDAITLSTARLVETGKLSPQEGWPVIITAIMSNTVFKGLLTIVLGRMALFKAVLLPVITSLVSGLLLLAYW